MLLKYIFLVVCFGATHGCPQGLFLALSQESGVSVLRASYGISEIKPKFIHIQDKHSSHYTLSPGYNISGKAYKRKGERGSRRIIKEKEKEKIIIIVETRDDQSHQN